MRAASPGTKYGVTSQTRRCAEWIAPTCRRWIASQSRIRPGHQHLRRRSGRGCGVGVMQRAAAAAPVA